MPLIYRPPDMKVPPALLAILLALFLFSGCGDDGRPGGTAGNESGLVGGPCINDNDCGQRVSRKYLHLVVRRFEQLPFWFILRRVGSRLDLLGRLHGHGGLPGAVVLSVGHRSRDERRQHGVGLPWVRPGLLSLGILKVRFHSTHG
jgi:hypothetical protein